VDWIGEERLLHLHAFRGVTKVDESVTVSKIDFDQHWAGHVGAKLTSH
jgi:hypothetical protein